MPRKNKVRGSRAARQCGVVNTQPVATAYIVIYADDDGIMAVKSCDNMMQVGRLAARQKLTKHDYVLVKGELIWGASIRKAAGKSPSRPSAQVESYGVCPMGSDLDPDLDESGGDDGQEDSTGEHLAAIRSRQDVIRELLKIKEEYN